MTILTGNAKRVLRFAHKLLNKTSKTLFGTTSHVTKKTGKGAAKLLGKVGKLTKPVRLDNGAIQYTLQGTGKGIVIITNVVSIYSSSLSLCFFCLHYIPRNLQFRKENLCVNTAKLLG